MKARAYFSEFIGAFALLYVGVGAVVSNQLSGPSGIGLLGIALAHGLVIAAMASAVGPISGGHFNPAVTVAALVGKRISVTDALVYIIVQAVGAIAAIWLLGQSIDLNALKNVEYGMPMVVDDTVGTSRAIILEAMFTFFLCFVVYGTAFFKRAPKIGALYVGFAVMMGILVIGGMTGAALNPVRWLGPALFVKEGGIANMEAIQIYILGPLIGGALAGLVFGYFLEKEPEMMEGTGGPSEAA